MQCMLRFLTFSWPRKLGTNRVKFDKSGFHADCIFQYRFKFVKKNKLILKTNKKQQKNQPEKRKIQSKPGVGIRAGPPGVRSGQPDFRAVGSGIGLEVIGTIGIGLRVIELGFSRLGLKKIGPGPGGPNAHPWSEQSDVFSILIRWILISAPYVIW